MRVNAGPDAACTRLHASTLRLDIGGTFLWDRCHCAWSREQKDGADCIDILQHKSAPRFFTVTNRIGPRQATASSIACPLLTFSKDTNSSAESEMLRLEATGKDYHQTLYSWGRVTLLH